MAKKTSSAKSASLKISEMTGPELVSKVKEIKQQLRKQRLEKSLHKNKNVRESFNLRKTLARALTRQNLVK